MKLITPIFLFSLPRSGSTLTQRILATHSEIETVSEPWILLPFLYSRIRNGVYAEYGHKLAVDAIEDFCAGLPGGADEYRSEVKELALRLYTRRAKAGARYFLDKTPRYHLIAMEIMSLFADAHVIFLWRNPMAIIASIIETWGAGRWNLYKYEVDLFDGLEQLVAAYRQAGNRAYAIRYEDLAEKGTEVLKRLFDHLGIKFDESQLAQFSDVALPGSMGDQTGRKIYKSLSQEPIEKWKKVLASPLRKVWCRRYLRWIGKDRLEVMGYDLDTILADLKSIPTRHGMVASDIAQMVLGFAFRIFEPWIMRDKLVRIGRRKRVYSHS